MLKSKQGWSGVVMGKLNQLKNCIWETEYWHCPLWKKQKYIFTYFVNMCHTEKFQISLGLWFSKCHWGLVIWNFAVWWFFIKWWPFFHFLHDSQCQIDTRKNRDPNFRGVSNLDFYWRMICCEMGAILSFFIHLWWPFCTYKCIMTDANLPLVQFPHHHATESTHLCVDIHAWWLFCTKKNRIADANFPLVQLPITTLLYPSFGFNIKIGSNIYGKPLK